MDYRDEVFSMQTVQLDGNSFDGCRFDRCEVVFKAYEAFRLRNSGMNESTLMFEGPAALTIEFLTAMYHSGPGGKQMIEGVLEGIKSGQFGSSGQKG